MIFHRALLREFASLAGAVFMTLFAIALTTRLIRLLGQAAGGKIPTDAVIAFLGFFALGALPVLLSLTMFISVLLTLTRSWRDSEMVIWFGSGPVAHRVAQAGDDVRAAADRGDRARCRCSSRRGRRR